ncbi:MAG: [NiFe]-hydrogenase assembly chaperone HybE [Sterolibacteriaceae bacterium]|nr:[NiFe]-hydrogenase assembly chaperone HybE [Candidatus Methylophosphatis haderslevensis]
MAAASPPSPHHGNPAPQVRAVFEHIWRTRMAQVPILNPKLQVDIVGWRAWQGEWLGVLVTPWSINLMLLPGSGGRFRKLAMDERQSWSFPSGSYDFMGGDEEGLGAYQICSLFSPVLQFDSHEQAVAAARAAIDALMGAESGEAVVAARLDKARADVQPVAERRMSRRLFLRGGR